MSRDRRANPTKLLACESDRHLNSNTSDDAASVEAESTQDAPRGSQMAISSLWGVFAEVGSYWQSVSPGALMSA